LPGTALRCRGETYSESKTAQEKNRDENAARGREGKIQPLKEFQGHGEVRFRNPTINIKTTYLEKRK